MSDVNGRLAASVPDAPPFYAPSPALFAPRQTAAGLWGATPFSLPLLRRCGGFLLFPYLVPFHPFESFRRG
ncbi:hypothetical protein E0D83_26895 [Klebsiella grimontii]|nr:hypothetical protein E0D83_26895 [Klebsiella grimontii]